MSGQENMVQNDAVTQRGTLTTRFFLVMLAVFLAGRSLTMAVLPVLDTSEARYAAVSRNMAVTGNFLEPQFIYRGVPIVFEGKPPLYFQCSGWCCRFFGVNEFAVRLPAFLSACAILLGCYWCCRKLRDEETGRLAVVICACTPIFFLFAGLCMTDLMLAGAVACAIMGYMRFEAANDAGDACGRRLGSLLFFGSLGVGMVTKGPVAVVMAGVPIFLYVLLNRRWGQLKHHSWLWGMLLFLAIALPWYVLMTRKNPDFLEYFFVNENFKRFLFKEYGDKYGAGRESFRGMAIVFYLLANLPFVVYGVWVAFCERRRMTIARLRRWLAKPLVGLSSLAILSNTLFWCLTSRVLLTYLLPTIPMTAILLAAVLRQLRSSRGECRCYCRGIAATAVVTLCLTIGATTYVALRGYLHTDEISKPAIQQAMALEEFAEYKCYFAHDAPYAAEFYMRERLHVHPRESRQSSLANSGDCLLFATEHDLSKVGGVEGVTGRRELFRCGKWHLFAPVGK